MSDEPNEVECDECGGTGYFIDDETGHEFECDECAGTGMVDED